MHLHLSVSSLGALLAGVLILIAPNLLRIILAIYLITVGVVGLLGLGSMRVF